MGIATQFIQNHQLLTTLTASSLISNSDETGWISIFYTISSVITHLTSCCRDHFKRSLGCKEVGASNRAPHQLSICGLKVHPFSSPTRSIHSESFSRQYSNYSLFLRASGRQTWIRRVLLNSLKYLLILVATCQKSQQTAATGLQFSPTVAMIRKRWDV